MVIDSGTYRWLLFLMSLMFRISSNLRVSLLVIIRFQRLFVMLLTRNLFLSKTSSPRSTGITTTITSCITGMSSVYPDVGNIDSTIPLDFTNVSWNLKSRLKSIIGIDLCLYW